MKKKYIFYINFKLVLIKFEGKYNKKIQRKNIRKIKKKLKVDKLFFFITSNSFYLF